VGLKSLKSLNLTNVYPNNNNNNKNKKKKKNNKVKSKPLELRSRVKIAIFMLKIRSKVCCNFGRTSQGDVVGKVSAHYYPVHLLSTQFICS
jgi:hypothetical protein